MAEYFVYMLRCSDGSYYAGVTNNVELRVAQHERGDDTSCYTFKRRPVTLVHQECFREVYDAIAREKQIKRWSKKKKEALIAGSDERLNELASCRNETHFKNASHVSLGAPCHPERSRGTRGDAH